MARAYSLDLRERVVAAVASGQTCRAVAVRFGVSVASVVKYQRFRATGRTAAKPMSGRRPYALEYQPSESLTHHAHACREHPRLRNLAISVTWMAETYPATTTEVSQR